MEQAMRVRRVLNSAIERCHLLLSRNFHFAALVGSSPESDRGCAKRQLIVQPVVTGRRNAEAESMGT